MRSIVIYSFSKWVSAYSGVNFMERMVIVLLQAAQSIYDNACREKKRVSRKRINSYK